MQETFFDSHCHLMDPRFAGDLEEVIGRSRDAGVTRLVFVGTDLETSRQAIELAHRFEDCYASVGIAPHSAARLPIRCTDELPWLAQDPKVVAVGEIGLEYHHPVAPAQIQQSFLRRQLQLARQLELPVIFHHRDADVDFRRIVEQEGPLSWGGVMHCFTGDRALLQWALTQKMYISYSGIISFSNSADLRQCLRETPLESLLIESDAPYLAPEPLRGKRCEPAMLPYTARAVAEVLQLSLPDIARITRSNTMRLFRLSDQRAPQIAYPMGRALYLNITNRCSNHCYFCIRYQQQELRGHRLLLEREPDLSEVIQAIHQHNLSDYEEVVFCGYGEPTCRMDLLVEVAEYLKKQGSRVRLNTNGQGNLINQCDIVPDLVGRVDTVCVSLNSADPQQYQEICRSEFGTQAWHAMVLFIQKCKAAGLNVKASVVELPEIDRQACEKLAQNIGVPIRWRPYAHE